MKTSLKLLAIAIAVVAGACKRAELPQREIVRPVKLFTFGSAERDLRFTYPGRVYANQTVEVGFEVTGKIANLAVVRGQQVRRGDLIAVLDKRDFQNALNAAQATLDEATATHERFKIAAEKNAISRQQLDEALAQMRVAESALDVQRKALEDTEIRADFEGIVANRYVESFQNIVAKEPIVSLQDISRLEIRVNIPETDVVRGGRASGQLVATFSAAPDVRFPCEVKEFSTEADPTTQTFLMTLLMDNPEELDLLPGMTAEIVWQPGGDAVGQGLTVPALAVGGVPGEGAWIWVVDPASMTVKRRDVDVGQIVDHDMIEVHSGISPGDIVASAGIHFLEEGMRVREYEAMASLDQADL